MSYINALIAQGGTPFDVAKYASAGHAGQLAKQNDLLNLQRQNAIDRAPIMNQREDEDYEIKTLARAAQEFVALGEAQDWEGAARVIEAIPDGLMGGKAAQLKADYRASMQTPGPEDNIKSLNGAKAFLQSVGGGQEGAEYTAPIEGVDEQGNPIFFQPSKQGGGRQLAGVRPAPQQADAPKMPRPLTPEIAQQFGIPPEEVGNYQIGSTGEVELVPARGGADGQDPKAIEIQRLMAQFPKLSKPEATALAYGKASLKTDLLGQTTFQNEVTQEIKIIEPAKQDNTSVITPESQTLYKAAEEGTGFWNAAARKLANIGAQVGFDPGFAKEEIKAKQILDSSLRNLKQGYALSEKYAVAEQGMIVEEAGLLVSLWEDPENMQARMIPLEGTLARNIAQAELDSRASSDPQVKREARRVARHMRSYMNAMAVPESKREDVRSWAQAQEGFFDMSKEDQERFIELTAAKALLGK